MNVYTLSEEEKAVRDTARQFAQERIKPIVDETLELSEFSPPHYKRALEELKNNGFSAIGIPEEYGGVSMSSGVVVLFIEELCKVAGDIGLSLGATFSLVGAPIAAFGNKKQKQKWLPKIARGEVTGCYCQTEPEAGSDVAAISTKAEKRDNKWYITGTKTFITNGSEANVALVLARTGEDPHKGLTMFIVNCNKAREQGTLNSAKNEKKAGLHQSPTTEMVFDNCEAEGVLGGIGNGWKIAIATLGGSRATAIPAQAVGIMKGARDIAYTYAQERKQFGRDILSFPLTQDKFAEIDAKIRMAELLTRQSALAKDEADPTDSRPYALEASAAKLVAGEFVEEVTSEAMQIMGGIGYVTESGMPRLWHDGRIIKIYEGTSEIQQLVIIRELASRAGELLGKLSGLDIRMKDFESAISKLANEQWPSMARRSNTKASSSPEIDLFKYRLESLKGKFLKAVMFALPNLTDLENIPAQWHKIAEAFAVLEGTAMVVENYYEGENPDDKEVVESALRIASRSVFEANPEVFEL